MEANVNVRGWVGTTVELRETGKGDVAKFRVAASARYRRDGEWVDGTTTWFSVDAWRGLGRNAAMSLRKGDPVVINGKLRTETWTGPDGLEKSKTVIEADTIGHDLNRGRSYFARVRYGDDPAEESTEAPAEVSARPEAGGEDDEDAFVDPETGEVVGLQPVG